MNLKAAIATVLVFVGCCSNVVFLEHLVKSDPGSGNLVTFAQFLFIAIEGLIFTSKFGTNKRHITLKAYSKLVVLFFASSVLNNYAFDFNIPMPLHMIFRAGSLIANMIMGIVILKKKYIPSKYISVFLISVGIVLCTLISGSNVQSTRVDAAENIEPTATVFFWWAVGILLLTTALFISAYMGIYQEVLYKRFGKHAREALFFTHMLPLPGFLLMFRNIGEHWTIASQSPEMQIGLLGFNIAMPETYFYLICNTITQYLCISSVYTLTAECASLTVTLIITLRKFISLLFSIMYFKNSFSIYHWIGTSLVFVGTIIFTEIVPQLRKAFFRTTPSTTKQSTKDTQHKMKIK